MNFHELVEVLVLLFAVIDPIGSVPVFIAVTRRHEASEKFGIACWAVGVAAGLLLFFIIAGQLLLTAIGVPLSTFQISGGIILFLFALTMIFGEGKPEGELRNLRSGRETAIFPLAVPSIASPGAMMAVVVLTDNLRYSFFHQLLTTGVMFAVLAITLGLLLSARWIHRAIGDAGASIVSRVMGLILASVAVNSVLEGITLYFHLNAAGG